MELEYSDRNSRRSKFYIAAGIVIAVIVAAIVFIALQASGLTRSSDVEMRQVVVAAAEIPGRKTISESDVVMRSVPADPVNEVAFTSIDEVLGRVAGVPISQGQLVTPNLLASTEVGATFSVLLPGEVWDPSMPDLRAVSMTVPDERAVGGSLQPGQRVDLIATVNVAPAEDEEGAAPTPEPTEAPPEQPQTGAERIAGPSTKTTLQALDILVRNGNLYILRTDLVRAEQIAELQAAGAQFSLVLRHDEDDRTAETEGSTLDMLLEEYQFPVPEEAELP